MNTVAIVGVGLIGGSFGLALRKNGFTGEILGVSSKSALDAGMAAGSISGGATLEQAARVADVIYLSQPIDRILQTLEILGPIARPGCLITDAGSTKAAIVSTASKHVGSGAFLGGHPLAGKEQRGAACADADLFRGRPYVLTPSSPLTPAMEEFRSWLTRLGANIVELSPVEHDVVVAFTSHLPQLLATTLANTLVQQDDAHIQQVFGPGLLDMTRLALSSSELWESIFLTNKTEILRALEAFVDCLHQVRAALERDCIHEWFRPAASFAEALRNLPRTTQR